MGVVLALAWAGPPLAEGGWSALVLVGGLAFIAAWGGVAIDAYRRAVRARADIGLPAEDGGALGLLWLVPFAIVGSVLLWGTGGGLERPETTLARYVAEWRAGTPSAARDAADLFVLRRPGGLADAWERQAARLTNELVRAAGAAGPAGGIDPYRPFESVRFERVDAGATGAAGTDGDDATVTVALRIVRREAVHGTVAGLLPTGSERLIPIAELGTITLRRIERASRRLLVPPSPVWLIERLDLLGESLP